MITEKQLEERKKYLGASDMAALFTDSTGKSLNPFMTAYDVWVTKVYELEKGKSTESQKRGNRYEPGILEYAAEELGVEICDDPEKLWFQCKEHSIFTSNLDGYCCKDMEMCIVEAKTTGHTDEFGIPYTDQVPLRTIIQVNTQFLCTGWKTAYVPVLTGGRWGLSENMYKVERNEDIINHIIEKGEDFWENNVLKNIPPDAGGPGDIQLLKRIKRVPEKYAEIDSDIVLSWELAKKERIAVEKEETRLLTIILMQLGDSEGAKLSDGREFTYFSQKGGKLIDRRKLENEYPQVYADVISENLFRVPRIRKGE